jgi:ribosomal-protein-alanine N-acetyltransferase
MLIREFRTIDLFRVYEIEKQTFPNPYEINILQYLYDIGMGFLVSVEKSLIIGYIIFNIEKETQGHIITIAVDEKFRKQNVGSSLLQTAINIMKKFNCEFIYLEVKVSNITAINFYKRFGFKTYKFLKNYYEDGFDAISMYLKLQ